MLLSDALVSAIWRALGSCTCFDRRTCVRKTVASTCEGEAHENELVQARPFAFARDKIPSELPSSMRPRHLKHQLFHETHPNVRDPGAEEARG
jgi:hypothetical protein